MTNQLELKLCWSQFLLKVLTRKTSEHRNQREYHWLLAFSTLNSHIFAIFFRIFARISRKSKRFLVVA